MTVLNCRECDLAITVDCEVPGNIFLRLILDPDAPLDLTNLRFDPATAASNMVLTNTPAARLNAIA